MSGGFNPAEFVAGFIAETEEHLVAANANLLAIEDAAGKGQAVPRQVRDLFRSLHTMKGLAAMVGVEPIVDVAHAMEAVLREADRASGLLPAGAVQLLLDGLRAIEQRVRALAKRKVVAAAPLALIESLNALRQAAGGGRGGGATGARAVLPGDLGGKLGPTEQQELVQGIEGGRRGWVLRFFPTPERAAAGVTITSVRERVAAMAEIVKVVPQSVPVSEQAPAGLAFALIVVSAAEPAAIAEAGSTALDALAPVTLEEPPADAGDEDGDQVLPRNGIVRVEVARLDDALEKLAALVVTQFRLVRVAAGVADSGLDRRALAQVVAENGRQLRDLRASIMRARMVSVAEMLDRVPLIVRGLSRTTGKDARLEIATGKAELDKAVAERVFPAIVHLVRNAVDHALESPEERRAAGKPDVGLVRVSCFERSDNQLELIVSDDGRGVDAALVARRAGVPVPTTDEALLDLLARPGLSTKTEVTTTSGRGMGMDVVKRVAVEELRGQLTMHTEPGQGTTFSLRVPLSITIVDALSFTCGGETFVVPVAMVEEIQEIDRARTIRGPDRRRAPRDGADRRRGVRAAEMIERRGEAIPILRLDEMFGLPVTLDGEQRRKAIIVRRNGEPFAFMVDRMLGQQEVVVRPLVDTLVRVDGVSGTTDLGDGRPTLVLDLAALGGKLVTDAGREPP